MKTSNKILLTIGILAISWTLFRSVILSIGVPQLASGQSSPFINRSGESAKINIDPFDDLKIESQGYVKITVKQGSKAGITGDRNLLNRIKVSQKGSTLQISCINRSASLGYLNITTPSVKSIQIINPDDVERSFVAVIQGLDTDSLDLTITRFQDLIIRDCKLKKLNVIARNSNKQYGDLGIRESNQIGNLSMDISGKGWLRLETAGTETNKIIAGDSVGISTSGQVLHMLRK